ncbi:MAG: AAA family ATPase [Parachlamydiaceae bacterium]|nr:AAA family ATPase [Parachlamydiaceae bacterium]
MNAFATNEPRELSRSGKRKISMPRSIILLGLPTSGKTTYGKLLASKLNYTFIDTDHLIENAYEAQMGQHFTCRQICLNEGLIKFRQLEKQQIASLNISKNSVISTGGGTVEDRGNVEILQKFGQLIYLKTPLEVLWKRICVRGLPSYLDPINPEESFYKNAKRLIPLFENAANHIIETTHLSEQELLTAILKRL